MIDAPTSERWSELRRKPPLGEDTLSTLPILDAGRETGLSIAIDHSQALHMLIPVESGPAGSKTSDLNGLRVRHLRLQSGQFLDLIADPAHERVFTPFCVEIARSVLDQKRNPWAAVASTIRAWQSAWKPVRPILDHTVQVGLFGELLVLRTVLLTALGPEAVTYWGGPESERHDFTVGRVHLEVKTTRRSRHEHEISRIDQLRVPEGRRLLLVSVLVESSLGGTETLGTSVDAVVDLLRESPAELDCFLVKMQRLGWSDEMRRTGELLKFSVRGASVYEVDDAFPKIPDDFVPPAGVVAVRYTIDLANLPSLGGDEVASIIADCRESTSG